MTSLRDSPLTISIAAGIVTAMLGLGAHAMLVGRWTAGIEASVSQVDKRVTEANQDRADRRADANLRYGQYDTRLARLDEANNTTRLSIQSLQQSMQSFTEIRSQLVDRTNIEIRNLQERIADLQRQVNEGRGPTELLKAEIAKMQADLAVIKNNLDRLLGTSMSTPPRR